MAKNVRTRSAGALVAAAIVPACALLAPSFARGQEAEAPPAELSQEAAPQPVSMTDPRVINMILVKVNGTPIFLSELTTELETRLASLRSIPEAEIEAQMPELRRQLLVGMIDQVMMDQRAEQLQITADANSVDRAIMRLREANDLTSDEEFAAALEAAGLTIDLLRDQMRRQIRQEQLAFQEVQRGIVVTDAEIQRYYEANPAEFEAPAQVRLEQLVFVGGAEMRQQAVEALEQLRGGATLAEVAAAYPAASAFPADDTFVRMSDLQESLAAVVPDLPVDRFSDPVESQFGWHLVRVVERQPRAVQPLDAVRDAVRQRLTIQKSNERMDAYLGQLREQTYIEIFAPEFASIEEYWRAADEADATTAAQGARR